MVEYDQSTNVKNKLKKLYFLHSDVEGPYYLLFKAIFETKLTYPKAYITAVRYRTWLINEIYSQLRTLRNDATFQDAKLFLYMIEGTIIQLLSSDVAIEREKVLDCFFCGVGLIQLLFIKKNLFIKHDSYNKWEHNKHLYSLI